MATADWLFGAPNYFESIKTLNAIAIAKGLRWQHPAKYRRQQKALSISIPLMNRTTGSVSDLEQFSQIFGPTWFELFFLLAFFFGSLGDRVEH